METFHLTAEEIMTAVDAIGDHLIQNGIDRKEALRVKFAAEEILLTYQNGCGEDTAVELFLEKRMGVSRIIFRIAGAALDPFGGMTEEDRLMHNLMENMGTAPTWSYRRSCNSVTFSIGKKKKMSSLTKVLIAVVLGVGLGLLVRTFPGTIASDISEKWMAPIQNAIMGLLSCLSALFVLLSVTSGICGMGDVSTFNRVGRRMIGHLMLALLIVTALTALVIPLLFPLSAGEGGKADLSVLWQMIVDIIPTNIIETFSTGNTMQIVFLAMFSSVVLLIMGPKAQQLVDIISQLSDLLQQLIQGVIALMPVVVFVSLFRLNADGDITQLISAYKYPLYILMLCVVFLIVHVLYTALRHHLSPLLLVKKLLPTMLIACSTASSAAALPENLNTCENRLGIDRQVMNVGIPLGQTVFMPSVVFTMIIGCMCAAQIFDVPVSFASYLILVITTYIVAIATPPVPGATMATFTLLLTQMGIPSDAMSFIIALDAIVDRICTGTYIAGLQMELVDISASLDMLDREKLHAAE